MRLFGTSGCFRFTVRFFYIFFFFFFIIISIRKTDKQLQLIFCYESTEMMDSRIESRYFLFFLQFDNIELEEIRTILFFSFFPNRFVRSIFQSESMRKVLKKREEAYLSMSCSRGRVRSPVDSGVVRSRVSIFPRCWTAL